MSDTNNTNAKNGPPAGNEISEDKSSSQEMPGQGKIETPQDTAEIEKAKGILGEVGEKATELTDVIVDKLRKGLSQAYEAGAKVVDELSQAAQEYVEKYKTESEIKKLKGEKDELITQLGQSILRQHLAGDRFAESFFSKKEMIDQFNQIETLDMKIIETGRQLDRKKE
jgi:hypothetical protein